MCSAPCILTAQAGRRYLIKCGLDIHSRSSTFPATSVAMRLLFPFRIELKSAIGGPAMAQIEPIRTHTIAAVARAFNNKEVNLRSRVRRQSSSINMSRKDVVARSLSMAMYVARSLRQADVCCKMHMLSVRGASPNFSSL